MHDSYVVVSLLKAIPIVLTVKILAICKVAKGLAPWASVWCGGEWANAYRLIPLGGGSYNLRKMSVFAPVFEVERKNITDQWLSETATGPLMLNYCHDDTTCATRNERIVIIEKGILYVTPVTTLSVSMSEWNPNISLTANQSCIHSAGNVWVPYDCYECGCVS